MTAQRGSLTGARRPLQVGAWTVDAESGVLTQGDSSVRVRPKVMDLLVALTERPGELWSKESLIARLWNDVVVGDASLSVLVAELREAFDDDTKSPKFIETIPRRGYRLIAAVRGVESVRTTRYALASTEGLVLLLEGENLIGRDPEAGVWIGSSLVSRHHSLIVVAGNTATIEDLDSKNGTYVNGKLVEEAELLSAGDRINLGRLAATYRFVVVDDDATITEASKVEQIGR